MLSLGIRVMLGVNFGRSVGPVALARLSRYAERLGYHSVWVPETWGRDAFVLLSMLSQKTQEIKLASCIVNIFSKTPSQIAMASGALSELSNGRFILGLGASGKRVIEDFHGIKFEKPVERMGETVDIITSLLSGKTANHVGTTFKTRDFYLNFKTSVPEIYIAALGPKMLDLAMAKGNILFNMKPINEIKKVNKGNGKIAAVLPCGSEEVRKGTVAFYIGQMGTHYHRSIRSVFPEADDVRELWKNGKRDDAAKAVTQEMLSSVTVSDSLDGFLPSVDLPIIGFDTKAQKEAEIKVQLQRFSEWA